MSEPAEPAPAAAPPAAVPAPGTAVPARPAPCTTRALVGAFSIDILVAVATLMVASVAAAIVWGVWRGVQVAASGQGGKADAEAIARAIGDPSVLAQMLMVIAGMSAAALVLYFLRQPATAAERAMSYQFLRRRSTLGWAVLVGVAVFVGNTALAWLMRQGGIEPAPSNEAMILEASERWPLFLVLFAVVLAPMYEELLFRRVLFGRFLRAGRPWLGLVLSSLAFALFHEVPGLSDNPPGAVLVLLTVYAGMGAAFAWLYWRTGTLWAPILAHALNNGLALALHGLA